jgi:hypothetical protein
VNSYVKCTATIAVLPLAPHNTQVFKAGAVCRFVCLDVPLGSCVKHWVLLLCRTLRRYMASSAALKHFLLVHASLHKCSRITALLHRRRRCFCSCWAVLATLNSGLLLPLLPEVPSNEHESATTFELPNRDLQAHGPIAGVPLRTLRPQPPVLICLQRCQQINSHKAKRA